MILATLALTILVIVLLFRALNHIFKALEQDARKTSYRSNFGKRRARP